MLLVEDDTAFRALLAEALRGAGYDVIEAADGADLFDYVAGVALGDERTPEPAVIVTDVRLPVYSGIDVVREARAADLETPVILMTAFGGAEASAVADELGASYIEKPFELRDLVAWIRVYAGQAVAESRRPGASVV